jgi:hypothetical protein
VLRTPIVRFEAACREARACALERASAEWIDGEKLPLQLAHRRDLGRVPGQRGRGSKARDVSQNLLLNVRAGFTPARDREARQTTHGCGLAPHLRLRPPFEFYTFIHFQEIIR